MHFDPREGFDPYRDTVGPGIYGGIVKRDENGEVKLKISHYFHQLFPNSLDTFQKAASEAGSRHSLYPMCEIKRSPSLISGQSDMRVKIVT